MSILECRDASWWLAQERAQPLKEGAIIGRYRIGAVTGADAISITYAAHDESQSRRVVLREFLPCVISRRDPDGSVRAAFHDCSEAFDWARDAFLREGQSQLRVHHPSLAPVTALQTISGSSFLAAVPVEGQSLDSLIESKTRLNAQALHELATPLLDGLKALHSVDQLHLGISAKSVLVAIDDAPVLPPAARAALELADGLDLQPETRGPAVAPERLVPDGAGFVGPQSDIYSLAATLYTAATGKPPASASDRLAALAQGAIDPLEPVEIHADGALTAVMAAAINDALQLDPQQRPATVGAWKQRFQGRYDKVVPSSEDYHPADPVETAPTQRPAKLETAISPPAPVMQPELPLPGLAAGERIPPARSPSHAAAREPTFPPPSGERSHGSHLADSPETLIVRPRRAAAAVASVSSVARSVGATATPSKAGLSVLKGKGGAFASRAWGGLASFAAAHFGGLGSRISGGARGAGRGLSGATVWLWDGLVTRRSVQIGSGVAVAAVLVVAGGIWMVGGDSGDPNVKPLKTAETQKKPVAKTKPQDVASRKPREKSDAEKAAEDASKAERDKVIAAEKQREAFKSRWTGIQKLEGEARIAAEKAYFEDAVVAFAEQAKDWHDGAIASHRDGDFAKAFELYGKAAAVGHLGAQVSLGFLYVKGHGTAQDPAAAALWFRRAAERGNRVAQSNLAGQYTTGRGVKRDFRAAHRWALAAAKQDDPTAHGRLGFLYRYGLGVKKNPRKAMAWYRKGAALNHVWSMAEIGALYEAGEGVRRNPKKAAEWYRRARRNGSQYAEQRLTAMRKGSRN